MSYFILNSLVSFNLFSFTLLFDTFVDVNAMAFIFTMI